MLRDDEGRTALVELSFAGMGVLKLLGLHNRMARRWGVPPRSMRRLGAIEAAGALMVANRRTRVLGAAGLAAVSALMLAAELRNREVELVLPRLALTGLAVATAIGAARGPLRKA